MGWTHLYCDKCWTAIRGADVPGRLRTTESLPCCRCGEPTQSGIYVREDARTLRCQGRGGAHSDEETTG
jgi:hypothetical protein